jgi:hypothetical protein
MLKNYSTTQFEPDNEGIILQNIESYSPNNKLPNLKIVETSICQKFMGHTKI